MSSKGAPSSRPAKVVIVDDHPVVRAGLSVCIAQCTDLVVCGEADDLASADRLIQETQPDLVLLDISLKGHHGLDLIRKVRAHCKEVRFLVASVHEESLYAERALRAGAAGFINKQESTNTFVTAIRQVLDGEIYVSAEMTRRILNRSVGARKPTPDASPLELLSDREMEIFELIGQGLALKTIAEQLHRSVHTVQAHRDNIRQKLGLAHSTDVTRRALLWILDHE